MRIFLLYLLLHYKFGLPVFFWGIPGLIVGNVNYEQPALDVGKNGDPSFDEEFYPLLHDKICRYKNKSIALCMNGMTVFTIF